MAAPLNPRRRGALARLVGIALALLALVAVVAMLLYARHLTTSDDSQRASPPKPSPSTTPATDQDGAERRLASRPMLRLPPRAALPQPLTEDTAGQPISLPKPAQRGGERVPNGFDVTPRGALARLVAITETGLRSGTPDGYAEVYRQVAQPGAPNPRSTALYLAVQGFYRGANADPADPRGEVSMTYEPTHGLIKGTASGGEYVVVCVLGRLSIEYRGHTSAAGIGDCQAMRHTGRGWLIADGALAYPAPHAWPGSADCVAAGYRELSS